jgi:PEP-CTERM motif-containing protein
MKRLRWTILVALALSCGAFADTIINLVPNDGSGDNFGALQRGGGVSIAVFGGTDPSYLSVRGYAPGAELGGGTTLFVGGGLITIHGSSTFLDAANLGSLTLSNFTLPTNGKDVTIPVSISFSASLIDPDTGQVYDVGGGASGKIKFIFSDGVYFADSRGFTTVPEPGTLGLLATGIVGILAAARKKLRI